MEHLSRRQAIETLEYVHDLLDRKKDEDVRRTLQNIINLFRTKEMFKEHLRQTVKANRTYVPPAL